MSVAQFFRSPASPRVVIIAFAAHLVSWSGFVIGTTASESWGFGFEQPIVMSMLLVALAAGAGASATIVARGLGSVWFSVVTVLNIVVFGGAGLAEVVKRTAPWPFDSPLWGLVMPFEPIGVFILPFVLTAVLVIVVGRFRGPAATVNRREMLVLGVVSVLCAVLIVTGLIVQIAGIWFVEAWVTLVCAIVGVVAVLIVLDRLARDPARELLRVGARVCACFIVLCGTHLVFLSAIQAVFSDAIGIGGALLLMVALLGFVTGSIVLDVLLAVSMRARLVACRT